jgi:hypothetical protein
MSFVRERRSWNEDFCAKDRARHRVKRDDTT